MMRSIRWLEGLWLGPVDVARLDLFRRAFALTLLVYLAYRLRTAPYRASRESLDPGVPSEGHGGDRPVTIRRGPDLA